MNQHKISSLSNASLKKYPNNTLSKFTHILPKTIKLDKNLQHTISLTSISLSHNLTHSEGEKYLGFVKVHLKELNPQTTPNQGDEQCVARIPYPKRDKNKTTFDHEFRNPVPIPLTNVEQIQKLSYLITDEHNQQLKLADGITTVINIVIEEMKYQDRFTITVNPSYSRSVYQFNNAGDFRTHFPSEIELDNTWEVALHSLIIPYSIIPETSELINEHLAIYCDIVEDSIIGDALCPLLDIISCENAGFLNEEKDTFYSIQNPTFRRLKKLSFTSVHISFNTLIGLPFDQLIWYGTATKDPTCTLMFRKHHE